MEAADIIKTTISFLPESDGFEVYPFRIGSYNSSVSKDFHLPYDNDALGILVLSTPDMFDVSFRNWITQKYKEYGSLATLREEVKNPISDFLDDRLQSLTDCMEMYHRLQFDLFHDHSMWPNRRPKVLMCSCGHVAGAAYYYQPKDLQQGEDEWPKKPNSDVNSKFIGLSLHPVYAGHFAFRCVIVFKDVHLPPDFQEPAPPTITKTREEAREALELFNYSWRDSRFRDIGAPQKRYSDTQMRYFGTPPAQRWEVIRDWFEEQA